MTKPDFTTRFPAGETIMRQGDHGNSAFVIQKGQVEILIEKESGLIQSLGTRSEGTIIGEMALIDQEPRTATVKAIEDCELIEITTQDFNRRLKNSDPIIKTITQIVLTRYRDIIKKAHIISGKDGFPRPEELEKRYADQNKALDTLKTGNEFKEALINNQLQLYYQPIIDLKKEQVIGFEALMRWNHPTKGFISPDIFIPIAEENGSIIDATRWGLDKACADCADLIRLTGSKDLFASVNFSGDDITHPDFNRLITTSLKNHGLKPENLHIEITERLLINNPEASRHNLKQCRDQGISISIDDFGTGYSSLSYLHYFPINILKIDRSFIKTIDSDPSCLSLVKSIIALGQNLNMKIIAEGIEENQHLSMLIAAGCDAGQGYFFAKPLPKDAFLEFYNNYDKK